MQTGTQPDLPCTNLWLSSVILCHLLSLAFGFAVRTWQDAAQQEHERNVMSQGKAMHELFQGRKL